MNRIVTAHDQPSRELLGGKAWALASAQRAGMPVPPWFVLSAAACDGDRTLSADLHLPLTAALAGLCPRGELVAVRSSAPDEDGATLSFAGQLESHLFVRPEEVAARVAEVWRSAFSPRIEAYRKEHGASPGRAPAVLVQRMVDPEVAGVAFSADPVSGRRGWTVIAAAPGVGSALVAGEKDADTYCVERSGDIVSRRLCGARPCIDDMQVRAVAALAQRCARHFSRPQDIEWAIAGGELWLLQSRPITSLARLADPDGELAIWDSSNIAESYGGVTTPLTFSFIRRCYEHAYRELGRLGGVAAEDIRANDDAYRRMLGFVRGRVYYNLVAWYRLLALAPGFRYNRAFLDDMLGVRERPDVAALVRRAPRSGYAAVLRQVFRTAVHYFTVDRINARFRERLDAALAGPQIALEEMRPDELADYFRLLERKLLTSWDAPLINDFFAMVFHGLLRRLVARWLGPEVAGLDNDLLSGESGIISFEPVRRIRGMARLAALEPDLAELLRSGSREAALERVARSPRLRECYVDYLAHFAERCPEELKLESVPLDQDPLPLLRAIGHLAAANRETGQAHPSGRSAAQARVAAALQGSPLRHLVFAWVLRNTRARVRDRENLRFERTRVFARVRRIVAELGKRLYALGLLEAPRDVFYLELEELLGFVEGTVTCTNLKPLCALRKAQHDAFRRGERPPRRFETYGVGQIEFGRTASMPPPTTESGEERRGAGCSPGLVRGRVRVVFDAASARLMPGEILVAERTDPGWVMLFASAIGLIVERGSLLSHAAIVAREMALPAVVGLSDACRWLRDGDLVELDGAAGTVRRLEGERLAA